MARYEKLIWVGCIIGCRWLPRRLLFKHSNIAITTAFPAEEKRCQRLFYVPNLWHASGVREVYISTKLSNEGGMIQLKIEIEESLVQQCIALHQLHPKRLQSECKDKSKEQ